MITVRVPKSFIFLANEEVPLNLSSSEQVEWCLKYVEDLTGKKIRMMQCRMPDRPRTENNYVMDFGSEVDLVQFKLTWPEIEITRL